MAKVTLRPEIAGISGKIDNLIFRTYKSGKVVAYKAPEYVRKKPVSEQELAARELFRKRIRRVNELVASGKSKQEAWTIAKHEILH